MVKPNTIRVYHFLIEIRVDESDPKKPSVDALENRLGDACQYFDGVRKVTVELDYITTP